MSDREERQHVIEVLKSWDGYFIGYTSDEVQEALKYAINSIEIDLKYDLLYEETSGQKIEPTTKNNLAVDCVSRQFMYELGATCIATRNKNGKLIALGAISELPSVTPQLSSGLEKNSKKLENPTTKNNLGVDWESYKDLDGNSLDDLILEVVQNNFDCGNTYGYKVADEIIGLLPSVTPIRPKGHWIVQPSNKEQGERDFIWWKCSECGQVIFSETEHDRLEFHAFCSRCGSDNREVVEE